MAIFPNSWKHTKVIPIPKPNKPQTDPSAYSPISLLNTLSKLFERIIATRIQSHINLHHLLPHSQFGFRKRHSTTTQLARITEHITHGFNLHKHTGMLLLDIEKAYDTIWIQGLLYKLILYKFPPYLLLLLKTFLENRSYSVHLNFSVSTPIFLQAGLPQGAVLSTTLFSLYIADLPTFPNTLLALYADDTAVLTQSWRPDTIHRRLTHASTLLLKYFSRWKLQVNTHKTEIILFTRRSPMTPPPFRCQQAVIPRAPQVKYLGVLLDSKLLFSNHIKTTSQKALGVLCKLFPLLARDSTLPVTTKLALYKLTIRSILTYAAQVWSSTSTSNLKHLQITQSKCLRVIGNLPKRTPIQQLHALLQVQPLNEYIYNLTTSFFNKCYSHPSPLIRTIGNYTLTDLRHLNPKYIHKRPKHLLLQQSIFPPKPNPPFPTPLDPLT